MIKDINIEKILTNRNVLTAKVNGFFLHSRYDPIRESLQWVEKNYKPNYLHILFGYGLGYHAKALQEKIKDTEDIIIIDPLYDLLNKDIDPNIEIIRNVEEDNFKKVLNKKIERFNRRVNIIVSPNYDRIFSEEYKTLLDIVTEQMKLNRINENTIRSFAETWQGNYILNLYSAVNDLSLFELKDKFNLPVVIASGGPSLTKQLPLLNQIKENVIIIAAGSTINTLISNDIVPDFVVSIDGGPGNFNHFKNLRSEQTTYIYSMTSHYGIRDSFDKPAYIFNSYGKEEMGHHLEKLTGIKYPVIAGGTSVANFAFAIATFISTGPISIIGQDLAYTNNKTHAENNKNFKVVDESYQIKRGMFTVQGYNNEEVLTDYVFLSMKESFETLMEIYGKGRKIFNCTEGGINIKGINNLLFKEFCQQHVSINVKKSAIKIKYITKSHSDLLNSMKKEIEVYKKIRSILIESLRLVNMSKLKSSFSSKILKDLGKNDEKLKTLLKEVSMRSIVDPITINIKNNYLPSPNESSIEAFNRVYNQNKDLYKQLIEALDVTVKYSNELIVKIENNGV